MFVNTQTKQYSAPPPTLNTTTIQALRAEIHTREYLTTDSYSLKKNLFNYFTETNSEKGLRKWWLYTDQHETQGSNLWLNQG